MARWRDSGIQDPLRTLRPPSYLYFIQFDKKHRTIQVLRDRFLTRIIVHNSIVFRLDLKKSRTNFQGVIYPSIVKRQNFYRIFLGNYLANYRLYLIILIPVEPNIFLVLFLFNPVIGLVYLYID